MVILWTMWFAYVPHKFKSVVTYILNLLIETPYRELITELFYILDQVIGC